MTLSQYIVCNMCQKRRSKCECNYPHTFSECSICHQMVYEYEHEFCTLCGRYDWDCGGHQERTDLCQCDFRKKEK